MERRGPSWIDWGGFQIYFSLLLACGVFLVLAVPFVGRVGDLQTASWRFPSHALFLANVTLLAILGTHLGSRDERSGRPIVHLVIPIAIAQFLLTPCYVFAAVLRPGGGTFWLVYVYAPLAASLCALAAATSRRRGRPFRPLATYPTTYALTLAYLVVPLLFGLAPAGWGALTLLSPIAATLRLVDPIGLWDPIGAFAAVIAGIGVIGAVRIRRRRRHV